VVRNDTLGIMDFVLDTHDWYLIFEYKEKKLPLPLTPNEYLQGEYNLLRQKIFAMFRHWPDDRSGILLKSNFEAIRYIYILNFTAEEIQAELVNMEKDGYLQIVDDKYHLTSEGRKTVYNL